VPDIYQGCEYWDFSLVDPDNRRPVDFEVRKRILREVREDLRPRAELARELYQSWPDGRIKLSSPRRAFEHGATIRVFSAMANMRLWNRRAIAPSGSWPLHGGKRCGTAVCIAPRLVAGLLDGKGLLAG